jgi:hypothetical protein
MVSNFRCASRSDAEIPTTAIDLCKLAANIQTRFSNVCRKGSENVVGNSLIFCVGHFLRGKPAASDGGILSLISIPSEARSSHGW